MDVFVEPDSGDFAPVAHRNFGHLETVGNIGGRVERLGAKVPGTAIYT